MPDNINCTPDNFAAELSEVIQTFNHSVVTAADEAAVEAAKNAVRELKITSPEKSGKYARGWTYKKEKKGSVIVYNRARPWLTHLLEYGHPIGGTGTTARGHAQAKPHIEAAERHAATAFEHFLQQKINKGD